MSITQKPFTTLTRLAPIVGSIIGWSFIILFFVVTVGIAFIVLPIYLFSIGVSWYVALSAYLLVIPTLVLSYLAFLFKDHVWDKHIKTWWIRNLIREKSK